MRPAGDRETQLIVLAVASGVIAVLSTILWIGESRESAQLNVDYGAVYAELREARERLTVWQQRVPVEPDVEAYVHDEGGTVLLHIHFEREDDMRHWWHKNVGTPPVVTKTNYVEQWRPQCTSSQ